jgi:hypothetical protein
MEHYGSQASNAAAGQHCMYLAFLGVRASVVLFHIVSTRPGPDM